MKNSFLYLTTVLIWGSTWLAIEFQLGIVAPEVSLFYRFTMAAILMWGYCKWRKLEMNYSLREHGYFVLLACFNFGFNYLVLYWAQAYLNSAMTSIAFSTLLIINIINTRLFFGKRIASRIYIGASIGIAGIVALFWHDFGGFDFSSTAMIGLVMALLGTFMASLGNMVSVRNSNKGIGVLQGNAWGMFYSSIILLVYIEFSGAEFIIDTRWSYLASLAYLTLFGTVFAFACYFVLLKNIGPEKASYTIVLFPIVAVILSTLFEGFVWQENTVLGFVLVITGNAVVLTPLKKLKMISLKYSQRQQQKAWLLK
ncbi:DMT family transporter [Corallincola holothuriorum]|uniref:DMT family transporter n=1 Tax=Corallincola holothuriorum TaxID=2282215 RepID=A0A368NGD4_9GAMM|nr:DMT family transporter [Corallincola holothuriorum]RCU49528.1 DMT family transporter [Corallincola holothuriorum]